MKALDNGSLRGSGTGYGQSRTKKHESQASNAKHLVRVKCNTSMHQAIILRSSQVKFSCSSFIIDSAVHKIRILKLYNKSFALKMNEGLVFTYSAIPLSHFDRFNCSEHFLLDFVFYFL